MMYADFVLTNDYGYPMLVQVTGDSVYNLLKLGEVETSSDDRPLHPQRIISVEVSR